MAGSAVDLEQGVPVSDIEFFTGGASARHEDAIREFQQELRNDRTPQCTWSPPSWRRQASRPAISTSNNRRGATLVRIRVDGMLRELTRIPPSLRTSVISRIKIFCDMDIAERCIPQDGRLLARIGEAQYDLRVSTLPTQYGEKINIRLLDRTALQLRFEDPGVLDGAWLCPAAAADLAPGHDSGDQLHRGRQIHHSLYRPQPLRSS
jgi:hypothetical protein